MRRAGPTWTLDWGDEHIEPAVGDVFRMVSPKGEVAGYGRVTAVRMVRTRKPLPAQYVARYRIGIERLAERDPGSPVSWTLNIHPRKPRKQPALDRDPFSPLL